MTPLLTLWPGKHLSALKEAVNERMDVAPYKDFYRQLDITDDGAAAMRKTLSSTYRELIGPESFDTVLHIAMPVPLWAEGISKTVEEVIRAIAGISDHCSLEIIGLQTALAELDGETVSEEIIAIQKANIDSISSLCASPSFHCCLCLTDNYIDTGASAKFDLDLFAKFLSLFFKVMIDVYSEVFNPLSACGEDHSVIAPGLSCLEFRRNMMVDYLLHRSFLAALDEAGVMKEEVDSQGAFERAYASLEGCDTFYSRFYDTTVEPLVASKLPEGEIAAKIKAPLDESVAELRKRLTSFMDDPKLSLPEKEATWAAILGRDNKHLSGTLYKQKELSFDDVYTEPTDLFVDTFNELCPGSGRLPERGNYPGLAFPDKEDGNPNPENSKAFDALPAIKRIKSELLDITAYLRAKEKELATLQAKTKEEPIVEGHLSEEGFVAGGEVRHLEHGVVEQPLKEVYTMPEGLKPRESVDLRKFFSPIRDQGCVGSCSSFSVIALYESILNRIQKNPVADAALSERFLFYHTNVKTGKIDEGSNFFEQLEIFGKYGTCSETLYPYTTTGLLAEPSQAAIDDAFNHRVLLAKQIPLQSGANKYEAITANHRILTTALTEGYPIAISLRLFDNFGKEAAGHVSRPTDEQIASKGEGNHAMVIVGYSERDKCYIVRNSWGTAFGDNGYCYISASYIDDPELNNFCCIITDTTDGPGVGTGGQAAPGLVASFGGTETELRIAAISNALDEAKIHYTSLTEVYRQLYAYYSDLQERLSQPFVRNDIRALAEADSAQRLTKLHKRKNELLASFTDTLKDYCRSYIVRCIRIGLCTVGLAAVCGLLNYFGINNRYTTWGWILTAILLVVTIAMVIHYKWARRRKRMELQDEIDAYAVSADKEQRRLTEMQLHFHVGGLVLDAMHQLRIELEADYDRLVSFNNNLSFWYAEDSEKAATLDTSSQAMFLNLTRAPLLDAFFEKHKRNIVKHISLSNAFRDYELSPEGMQKIRDRLAQETAAAIESLFDDFTMIDYLQQYRKYEYLPPVELENTLKVLNRMSSVMTRHNDDSRTYESKYSLIKVPQDRVDAWRSLCQPHFDFIPMVLSSAARDSLTILTLKKISPEALVM